jgi:hypothetical protein
MATTHQHWKIFVFGAALFFGGCEEPAPNKVAPDHRLDDPRVVKVGDRYYPQDDVPFNAQKRDYSLPRGFLASDESNSKCLIFSPEFGRARCCEMDYGLDLDLVAAACSFGTYLGEARSGGCSYSFAATDSGTDPAAHATIQTSVSAGYTPLEAANRHLDGLKFKAGRPELLPEQLSNSPSIYAAHLQGTSWAFVPGWRSIRMVTWKTAQCSTAAMLKALEAMATTDVQTLK